MTPEEFATKAHEGAIRKGTNIPYITHPREAAAIVATMTDDKDVIAAAWLHDVVEDTKFTLEDIRKEFGDRVADLVGQETENKREDQPAEDTWRTRKQETLDHLGEASLEVKMVALGDKLSNLRAIAKDYKAEGDKLWERFNQKDKNEHKWYYEGIADCMPELEEYEAYQEYKKLLAEVFGE